jgi:hypothetical protein
MFLKLVINAMIRNIKIHTIFFDSIEISKSMELKKCIHGKKKKENIYLSVSYGFQSSLGPRKSRCDVLGGTTKDGFAQEIIR